MNNWLHSAHVSKQQPRQEPKYSNTSTDVEKTMAASARSRASRKHLHGRGEDCTLLAPKYDCAETPPRTWRRLSFPSVYYLKGWKHLHGRGEDLKSLMLMGSDGETPPRTWRRPDRPRESIMPLGNTSTDVEKTEMPKTKKPRKAETPPRTWRRQCPYPGSRRNRGNTSTDVEKTPLRQTP